MNCNKCNSELTEVPALIGNKPMYMCKPCSNGLAKAKNELGQAIKDKELDSARFRSGITKRLTGTTFDSFKATCKASGDALASCVEYLGKVKRKELVGGLALIGRCGTGKSLMAAAMVEELGYDDNVSRIRTLSGLVLELKESWRNGSTVSESELIQFYTSSVDLLIVDEVGMQRGSDTEALLLFSILDGRYNNMLPTVMISNLPINDFKLAVGERCIDRLKDDNGQIVAFNWESNRK